MERLHSSAAHEIKTITQLRLSPETTAQRHQLRRESVIYLRTRFLFSCGQKRRKWTEIKKVNPMLAALARCPQESIHLRRANISARTAVGASRLAKKHHHDPLPLALIGAERRTQPLLLLLLRLLSWQPQKTASCSMVAGGFCRTVNSSSTPNQCPTAVHHCSNPPESESCFGVLPDSAYRESVAVQRRHFVKVSTRCKSPLLQPRTIRSVSVWSVAS